MENENNNNQVDITAEKIALYSLISDAVDEEPKIIVETISENLNDQISSGDEITSADIMAEVMQSPQVISEITDPEEKVSKTDLDNIKKEIENSLTPKLKQLNDNIASVATVDRNPKRFTENRPTYSLNGLIFYDRLTQITKAPEWV